MLIRYCFHPLQHRRCEEYSPSQAVPLTSQTATSFPHRALRLSYRLFIPYDVSYFRKKLPYRIFPHLSSSDSLLSIMRCRTLDASHHVFFAEKDGFLCSRSIPHTSDRQETEGVHLYPKHMFRDAVAFFTMQKGNASPQ